MIRELRRGHLRLAVALAVAVPGLAVAAIAVRPQTTAVTELPGGQAAPQGRLLAGPPRFPVTVTVTAARADSVELGITAPPTLLAADLLLYWAATPATGGALPPGAILIGPAGATRPETGRLARETLAGPGYLVLWANAVRTVVATTPTSPATGQR